jgi:hypothetical protein
VIARRTLLLAAFALPGCASFRDPAAGDFQVGSGFVVSLARDWTDFSGSRPHFVRLLSRNGIALDRLYLARDLSNLEGLRGRVRKDAPHIHAGMSDTELAAYIAHCVDASGYTAPQITDTRPQAFGAARGLRLDLATRTGDGLDIGGAALATERDGKVQLILFLAAREHYFAALLPEVEAIMSSAVLL